MGIRYLSSISLVITSGYYITKLPLSPIYIFAIFSFYLFSIYIFIKRKVTFNNIFIIPFIYTLYLVIFQYFIDADLNTTVNVIMSISYFIISFIILSGLSFEKIKKISIIFIRFSIPLVIIEAVYRLMNPKFVTDSGFDYGTREDLLFYAYKFNSIMYMDSNFVGIFLVSLYFFTYYLSKYYFIKLNIEKIVFLILIFLTLSRAAILSTLFFILFFFLWFKSSRIIKIVIFIVLSLVLVGILTVLSTDISFQTKFYILDLFLNFLKNATLQEFLFGIGFGNTVKYFGIGAHNFFIAHFVESGFFGFSLLIIFLISIVISSKYKVLIVLLPFLLTGMSLAGHAITYLYVICTIIILLEKYKGK